MNIERRETDRRVDPNAWTPQHKRTVLFVYGLIVGGVLITAGLVVIVWAVLSDQVSNLVAGLGVALVAGGLVASLPSVFLPIFSAVLKKIPWGRVADNGSITTALRQLEAPDENE